MNPGIPRRLKIACGGRMRHLVSIKHQVREKLENRGILERYVTSSPLKSATEPTRKMYLRKVECGT